LCFQRDWTAFVLYWGYYNTMKLIPLTQNKFAIVDEDDYDELIKLKWHAGKYGHKFYAKKGGPATGSRKIRSAQIKMHRFIMKVTDPKIHIDHVNGNTLDNRKSNLRACTMGQNSKNRSSARNSASKYLGVNTHKKINILSDGTPKKYQYWRAEIRINGKAIFLGQFPFTEEGEILSAKAYDEAAIKYHGEFANLNFK